LKTTIIISISSNMDGSSREKKIRDLRNVLNASYQCIKPLEGKEDKVIKIA